MQSFSLRISVMKTLQSYCCFSEFYFSYETVHENFIT